MARAMWSGAIGFGMVNIPVKLYTATDNKNISFHLIHKDCQSRIKEMRWCPTCDKQIEWSEVEKGYEYAKSKYITLTDEDFEQLPLPSKNIVQVTSFVKLEEMDPIYFEKSYFLEPEKTGGHPYNLFIHALKQKEMIGLGTVSLRTKERLCALRPVGDTLLLTTLLYPDEVKIDLSAKMPEAKISKQEMAMASNLIDLLAEKFEPEKYQDHYREALNELIDSKLEGVDLEEEEEAPKRRKGEVLDLMSALEVSLSNLKGGNKKSKAKAKKAEQNTEVEEEAEEEKPKTKSRAAARTSKSTAKTKAASSASRTRRTASKKATAQKKVTEHKKTTKRGAA